MIVVSLPGGEHCRRTKKSAALRGSPADRPLQKQGGGKWSSSLLPLVQWAGPPWKRPVEHCYSDKSANGLCRSISFQCQQFPDVCAQRVMRWSPTSHSAICSPPMDIRISSGCFQQTARDALHVRICTRRVARAILRGCSCCRMVSVPFMVSKRMYRTRRTRALCVKVSMQPLLYSF